MSYLKYCLNHIEIHTHTHMCMCICICIVCMYACAYLLLHVCACEHARTCEYAYMRMCIYVPVHNCALWIPMPVHTHAHTQAQVHEHVYVFSYLLNFIIIYLQWKHYYSLIFFSSIFCLNDYIVSIISYWTLINKILFYSAYIY